MLRIGEFSKLSKITIKTLRYYDKIGLLKPAMIDTASSYRYYTEAQLETARMIALYKAAGIGNDMIAKLLGETGDVREMLRYQRRLLLARQEEVQNALSCLDRLLDEGKKQHYTATVKSVERRLVYYCRGYAANTECIYDFMKTCAALLTKTNPDVRRSEPDYCCVIYPDDGYRESNIFIEYAQSVDRIGTDTETLKFKEIEPITAVSVLHRGRYEELRDAYLFAVRWAGEHGYVLDGEPRERYIDGVWNRDNVSDWLTELQLPVKER